MSEPLIVRPDPTESASWTLHPPIDPYGGRDVAEMRVELHAEGLHAERAVTLSWAPAGADPNLVAFLQSLTAGWQGWAGERTWRSLDDDMLIDALHDGRGHVTLGATVRRHSRFEPPWSARVAVVVEAGEQLSRLVADLRAFFAHSPARR